MSNRISVSADAFPIAQAVDAHPNGVLVVGQGGPHLHGAEQQHRAFSAAP